MLGRMRWQSVSSRRLLSIGSREGGHVIGGASSPWQRRTSHDCSSAQRRWQDAERWATRRTGSVRYRQTNYCLRLRLVAMADRQCAPLDVCPGHDLQDQHIRESTSGESAALRGLTSASRLHAAQMPQLRRCGGPIASVLPQLVAHALQNRTSPPCEETRRQRTLDRP